MKLCCQAAGLKTFTILQLIKDNIPRSRYLTHQNAYLNIRGHSTCSYIPYCRTNTGSISIFSYWPNELTIILRLTGCTCITNIVNLPLTTFSIFVYQDTSHLKRGQGCWFSDLFCYGLHIIKQLLLEQSLSAHKATSPNVGLVIICKCCRFDLESFSLIHELW